MPHQYLDRESCEQAYINGRNAYRDGVNINPYPSDSLEAIIWQVGQEDAHAEESESSTAEE